MAETNQEVQSPNGTIKIMSEAISTLQDEVRLLPALQDQVNELQPLVEGVSNMEKQLDELRGMMAAMLTQKESRPPRSAESSGYATPKSTASKLYDCESDVEDV